MSHSAQKFLGCLQRSSGLGWNGLFGLFIGHENTESDAHLHKPSQFWCEMLESLTCLNASNCKQTADKHSGLLNTSWFFLEIYDHLKCL